MAIPILLFLASSRDSSRSSCAALVVVNKNAVNAAMFLLLSLVGVAGLFVLLDAALLAFVLILVYAGAVVALFLFIIMLLDTKGKQSISLNKLTIFASGIGGLLLFLGVYLLLYARAPGRAHLPATGHRGRRPPSSRTPTSSSRFISCRSRSSAFSS